MEEKTRSEILNDVSEDLLEEYGSRVEKHDLPRSIDLHLRKDGKDSFFCVMAVSLNEKTGRYFDATVSSEWDFIQKQRDKPNEVLFAIYRKDREDQDKRTVVLTPEQVLACSVPHLTSFQIKFDISKEELNNSDKINGKRGIKEEKLYSAIKSFNSVKKRFEKKGKSKK